MKKKLLFIVLICIVAISFIVVTSGCSQLDPCKRQHEECIYSCGDGWLSGLCKEGCAAEYRRCKNIG